MLVRYTGTADYRDIDVTALQGLGIQSDKDLRWGKGSVIDLPESDAMSLVNSVDEFEVVTLEQLEALSQPEEPAPTQPEGQLPFTNSPPPPDSDAAGSDTESEGADTAGDDE
jgi:hypothetical protein